MSERHEDNTETTKTSPFCEKSSEIWIYNQLTTADSVQRLWCSCRDVSPPYQETDSVSYQNKESLSSYKMRACEAVNTDKAWLWLSVILLLCISHRSTFTVWLIVLLWNWKLQIRTNSSESCMTLCDAHPCLFDWFLNQWSDSAALKRLHCTVMVCECAHIQTEKDSAW